MSAEALPIPDPIPSSASAEKAGLIRDALQALRTAEMIDERNDLDLDLAGLIAWYDNTIPLVTNLQIVVGALKIELAGRRGAYVRHQGEQRGGDVKSDPAQIKVSQRDTLTNAAKLRRSRDRLIASEPEAVTAYVQQEVAAEREPSLRGAVRAAKQARPSTPVRAKPTTTAKAKTKVTSFSRQVRAEVDARVKALLGKTYTFEKLADRWDTGEFDTQRNVRECALVATVTLDDSGESEKYTFARAPEPPSLAALRQTVADLRTELVQRRAANHDQRGKRNWDPFQVSLAEQKGVLDFVEVRLDRLVGQIDAMTAVERTAMVAWVQSLDAEIDRRRAANHDKFGAHSWCPTEIKKAEQTDMLNWLQRQFKAWLSAGGGDVSAGTPAPEAKS